MVVVKVTGGLGNQMFQYAAGRRLAHSLETTLKLDVSYFSSQTALSGQDTPRSYRLGHFNIQEDFATADEIDRLTGVAGGPLRKLAIRFIRRMIGGGRSAVFREKGFAFDPSMLEIQGDVYLKGYWQSEKYFGEIAELIRHEFTMKQPFSELSATMADLISGTESVSIHIRRGDYVASRKMNRLHGVCSMEYYVGAVARITEAVHEPHFFVFSDDPEWGATNLSLKYPTTLVSHNGPLKDYEDLCLMALCKHHIIANSSFSWWGAWLSTNGDKIIFAPRKWFNDPAIDTQDVIPPTWTQYESENAG
jgi:hypothetical protein